MRLVTGNKNNRLLGFMHEVRERFATRPTIKHPDNHGVKWPCEPPVVSVLVDGNDQKKVIWKVEEHDPICPPVFLNDGPDFNRFTIRHMKCHGSNNTTLTQGLCPACHVKKHHLFRRFDAQVTKRSSDFKPNSRRSLEKTTSLSNKRIDNLQKESRRLKKKLSYYEKLSEKMIEQTGVEVQVNETSDSLFSVDTAVRE